jgi:hypothetical protein
MLFLAVAEELSYTRAAERVGIAQVLPNHAARAITPLRCARSSEHAAE